MANPYLDQSNPQLQNNINAAQGDLTRSYNMTAQPAYNNAMARSGSFGNEGVAQMNANGQQNLQRSLGRVASDMRSTDYGQQKLMYQWDQNMDRSIYNDKFAQNNSNLQTGIGLLGTMNNYNQNNLANGTTIQNTPLNYYGQFSDKANSIGQGYGASTGMTGSSSSPFTSALGGAQLAGSAYDKYGSGIKNALGYGGGPTDSSGYALSNYGAGGSAAGTTPYL